MGITDIQTACDQVTVSMVIRAMESLRSPVDLIIAIVERVIGNRAVFDFQDVSSGEILYNKSIRTGGT
eukprot:9289272-Pyramimonas_sp.AAC.1